MDRLEVIRQLQKRANSLTDGDTQITKIHVAMWELGAISGETVGQETLEELGVYKLGVEMEGNGYLLDGEDGGVEEGQLG